MLGATSAGRGRTDEAIAHYQEALKIKPEYAEAQYNLGIALAACGRIDEAVEHYQKALEIRPDYAEAHINLGTVLLNQGRRDEARGVLPKGPGVGHATGQSVDGREPKRGCGRTKPELPPGTRNSRPTIDPACPVKRNADERPGCRTRQPAFQIAVLFRDVEETVDFPRQRPSRVALRGRGPVLSQCLLQDLTLPFKRSDAIFRLGLTPAMQHQVFHTHRGVPGGLRSKVGNRSFQPVSQFSHFRQVAPLQG